MKTTCRLLAAALLLACAVGAQGPQGSEFQANVYTSGRQAAPAVSLDSDGSFVVVWEARYPEFGVFGRRYDSAGLAVGDDFQISETTTASQSSPAISRSATDGSFLVVWRSAGEGLLARQISSGGAQLGNEFQIAVDTTSDLNGWPRAESAADGSFVVVWQRVGPLYEVLGRRVSGSGAPLDAEFAISATTLYSESPSIDRASDDTFVVVWTEDDNPPYSRIRGRRLGSDAAPGSFFEVTTATTSDLGDSDVDHAADGSFTVVWDDDDSQIRGQRFNASAVAIGSQFQVSQSTDPYVTLSAPRVADDGDGGFLVAWQVFDDTPETDDTTDVAFRRFDASATPVEEARFANSYRPGRQRAVEVDALPTLGPILVWESRQSGKAGKGTAPDDSQDGSNTGIFGKSGVHDLDGDSVSNLDDNCWMVSNPGQEDEDGDGEGDVCDTTIFSDGFESGDLGAWS